MSRRFQDSNNWQQTIRSWIRPDSLRPKREPQEQHSESAVVEFLEERTVLTSITGLGSIGEQLAADSASPSSLINTDQSLAMAVQSDGKIILVGSAEINTNGNTDFAVTRLNPDGSLDSTFGVNGKKTIAFDLGGDNSDVATCVAIQSDGKIVIGGYSQITISGNYDFSVVRLNPSGSVDTTFGVGGKTTVAFDAGGTDDDKASGVAIQSDGTIVLVGHAKTAFNGAHDIAVARLNSNGQLDVSFSEDGKKRVDFHQGDDWATAVSIQSNGRIVVVGATQQGSSDYDFAVVRINSNGSMDRSFTGDGKKIIGFNRGGSNNELASSIAIQSDGAIVIAGTSNSKIGAGDFAVARVRPSGSLDTHFGTVGRKTIAFDLGGTSFDNLANDDELNGVAIQPDGKVVLAGFSQVNTTGDFDFAAVRLDSSGDLDTTFSSDGKKTVPFNLGGAHTDLARSISLQNNGKILLSGSGIQSDPANTDFAITRLNSDGEVDQTFATNGLKTVPFDLTH